METKVTVVTRKKGLGLVQYIDGGAYWRNWVPLEIIEERGVDFYVIDPYRGIPYGENFSSFLTDDGVSEEVANRIEFELKHTGVWTWADVVNNPNLVIRAYMSAHRAFAAPLIKYAVDQVRMEK